MWHLFGDLGSIKLVYKVAGMLAKEAHSYSALFESYCLENVFYLIELVYLHSDPIVNKYSIFPYFDRQYFLMSRLLIDKMSDF